MAFGSHDSPAGQGSWAGSSLTPDLDVSLGRTRGGTAPTHLHQATRRMLRGVPLLTPPPRSSRGPSGPSPLLPRAFTPGPSLRDAAHRWQQPTSGPAPAFASPHGGAAQRGLELADLDGRVGAEALLELLHQGLHRLLRHLGSCNTSKGIMVRRCPSVPSPTGTALSSGSLSPSGQHGTPACQVSQRAPPNPSQKHRNKQRRSLRKLHFLSCCFTALSIIPCPFLHSEALSQGFKAGRTPLAATRSPHPNPRLSSFWVLHLHCSSPEKTASIHHGRLADIYATALPVLTPQHPEIPFKKITKPQKKQNRPTKPATAGRKQKCLQMAKMKFRIKRSVLQKVTEVTWVYQTTQPPSAPRKNPAAEHHLWLRPHRKAPGVSGWLKKARPACRAPMGAGADHARPAHLGISPGISELPR